MVSIALLSDIHIPDRCREFPLQKIQNSTTNCSYLFGLGDYTTSETVETIKKVMPQYYLVHGNMDKADLKRHLSEKLELEINGLRFGLIHGWGSPLGIRKKISQKFDNVDVICYGHTHSREDTTYNGIRFINPGSLCKNEFTIITINDNGSLTVTHIDL